MTPNTPEPAPTFVSVTHALFQARMWREYAMTFDGKPTRLGIDRRWCETVGRWDRAYCMKRAWIAARAAQRINQEIDAMDRAAELETTGGEA